MVVEALVPSVKQDIETGIEEIEAKVAELCSDGFWYFCVGSEIETCQVLF